MKREILSENEIYNKIYLDSKTVSWLSSSPERKEFVESTYKKLTPPVRVLDIGCGTGQNTSWIGDIKGNEWTGIDTVAPEILKVKIPNNGKFIQSNFIDQIFNEKFNLIVDQGGGINFASKCTGN